MNEKETALPDELDQMVKTLKKERGRYRSKRIFCFLGDREAAVNAEYLLMLSQVTGAKSVYLSEKRPEKSIIYGSGEKWSVYCASGIFYRRGSEKFLDRIGDV